jgi:hypothetical protein
MGWSNPTNGRTYQTGLFPAIGGPRNLLPSLGSILSPILYPPAIGWGVVEAALTQQATNEYVGGPQSGLGQYFFDTVGVPVGHAMQPSGGIGMTVVYKVVWNWIESSGATWSESYWVNAASAAAAATPVYGVLQTRMSIADPTVILKNIRSFSTLSSRDTFINTYLIPGKYSASSIFGPAPAGAAAVVSLGAPGSRSVYHWWRGLPQELVRLNSLTGFPNPPPYLTNAIQAFAGYYGLAGAGIRVLNTPQRFQIVLLTYNPVTKLTLVEYQNPPTGAPFAISPNNRVIIQLASKKDLPALNGGWTVQNFVAAAAGATGTFEIPYTLPNSLTTIATGATVKNQGYSTITPYNSGYATLAYYGTRSTHSTFSDSRGAKRAVRLRTLA